VKNEIREVRRLLGLTQIELAYRLGVGIGCVAEWEAGIHNPSGYLRPVIRAFIAGGGQTPSALVDPDQHRLPPPSWDPVAIRDLRRELGMSQSVFAGALGLGSKQHVSGWERGLNSPSTHMAWRLSRVQEILRTNGNLDEFLKAMQPRRW